MPFFITIKKKSEIRFLNGIVTMLNYICTFYFVMHCILGMRTEVVCEER